MFHCSSIHLSLSRKRRVEELETQAKMQAVAALEMKQKLDQTEIRHLEEMCEKGVLINKLEDQLECHTQALMEIQGTLSAKDKTLALIQSKNDHLQERIHNEAANSRRVTQSLQEKLTKEIQDHSATRSEYDRRQMALVEQIWELTEARHESDIRISKLENSIASRGDVISPTSTSFDVLAKHYEIQAEESAVLLSRLIELQGIFEKAQKQTAAVMQQQPSLEQKNRELATENAELKKQLRQISKESNQMPKDFEKRVSGAK
jgi:chromosome segregation ATPase